MKKGKKYFFTFLGFIGFLIFSLPGLSSVNKPPLTVAESSHFTETSMYADVISFIKELQRQSPLIKVETLCMSTEGRAVPLLIIGKPCPSSPLDLRFDKRAIIYIQANIHAGEVEGKEASLMLARDIVLKESPSYLDDLVILISPIFNADGNDKISPSNRRNQVGPAKGVGVRYNGQNLDLNRDSMKIESPELKGLVRNVLMRWDPLLLVDCHTTNGSYHEESVTYSWPLNPNGDTDIIEYMRDRMMPSIGKILKEKYNTLSIPYGNFMDFEQPEKGWKSADPLPRFLTNYIGLRNRLAILNENYAYSDYKTRVYGCYHFLLSILDYCALHKDEIIALTIEADRKTIEKGIHASEKDKFGIEFERKSLQDKITIRGWEMEVIPRAQGWPRVKKKDRKKTYILPYLADYAPKRAVPFPHAYLIPLAESALAEKLLEHGLIVDRLTDSVSLEVETFRVNELKASERVFQGHRLNSVSGEYFIEKKEFSKGILFVSTAQPLGNLVAYLLEPESDDGLLVWNFFDRYLVHQWRRQPQIYPVYKLMKPLNLARERIQ